MTSMTPIVAQDIVDGSINRRGKSMGFNQNATLETNGDIATVLCQDVCDALFKAKYRFSMSNDIPAHFQLRTVDQNLHVISTAIALV